MKIAVASEGKSLNSMISSRAGRAPFYLIFEGKSLIEVVKNPFAVGGGGAGWSVAYMLSEKGVDLVIAEKMGPNMKAALEERGVEFREVRGKVGKVIEGLGS